MNRLTTDHVPKAILRQLLKFRDMFHQLILVQTFASQLVVAPMQSNRMIPDNPRNIDLLMQVLILFRLVEFELVGFHLWLICVWLIQ